MNILEINNDFKFDDLDLEAPSSMSGGSYFTKLINKNNFKNIYLQLPKCNTKQGIIKNSTKTYTDLMFNSSEILLLKWLEEFELFCQKKIFEKKELWFHSDFTLNDIQEMMNPLTRIYKSGKYTLLRSQIKNNKIKIYDENENILEIDNLKNEDNIIPLIHLGGIKFTSNNFTIDINLVQIMIVNQDDNLDNCIINIKNTKSVKKGEHDNLEINEHDNTIIQSLENLNNNSDNLSLHDLENNVENNVENNEENNEDENIENNDMLSIVEQNNNFSNNLILEEINLDEISEEKEKIDLKDAEMVYYEIYKAARKKAKQIKKNAIDAYLEAKKIKNQYMLENIDESSDSDIDEIEIQ
jgi:hypothetical protein